MADNKLDLNPVHLDYWLVDAEKMKQAADLCWAAKDNVHQNADNAKLLGLDKDLIENAVNAEVELNWLYPNLISFAIQHLAIGILLNRNPQQILGHGAQLPIISMVAQCEVPIHPEIEPILSEVENSFKWNEKIPRWSVRLSSEQIQLLKRHAAKVNAVTVTQKNLLDGLYNDLKKLALAETKLTSSGKIPHTNYPPEPGDGTTPATQAKPVQNQN